DDAVTVRVVAVHPLATVHLTERRRRSHPTGSLRSLVDRPSTRQHDAEPAVLLAGEHPRPVQRESRVPSVLGLLFGRARIVGPVGLVLGNGPTEVLDGPYDRLPSGVLHMLDEVLGCDLREPLGVPSLVP